MDRIFKRRFCFVLFDASFDVVLTVYPRSVGGEGVAADHCTQPCPPHLGGGSVRTLSNNRRKTSIKRRKRRQQPHYKVQVGLC